MVGCQIIATPTSFPREPLGRQLVFTAKALREGFERALEEAGGSLGVWVVLNALSDEGFISQKVLAGRAHVDGATITHHVDRVEALGLVRRQVDPEDRRVRRLELTPDGARLHRRLLAVALDFEAGALADLDEADLSALREILGKIRANVDAREGALPVRGRRDKG